jgi:hypothetical protein
MFWNGENTGGPVLTGARLERTKAACDEKHLTIPRRYPARERRDLAKSQRRKFTEKMADVAMPPKQDKKKVIVTLR